MKTLNQLLSILMFVIFSACGKGGVLLSFPVVPTPTPAIWSGIKQLGVASQLAVGTTIAADSSGNIYTAGWTTGGLDGNTLTGTRDFFLTKYNSIGVKQWTRQLGVPGQFTYGQGIVSDLSGNIYITGYTLGGLDGNTLTGTEDFFITKYSASGVKQWTNQLGVAAAFSVGVGVTPDTSGSIYVAGYTSGALDGITLTGTTDLFLSKFNSNGVKQWTKLLGVASVSTHANGIASDGLGNAYITGYTNGGLDGNTLTGTMDAFVTKYNSNGVKQWTAQIGVSGQMTYSAAIACDVSGVCYCTGFTTGGLDGNTLSGTRDFFVVKYNASGVKQWTKQLGVTAISTEGKGITADISGNIYISGYTLGNLDGNTLLGSEDYFVTKYDSSGVKQWTREMGDATHNVSTGANAITSDSSGNIYNTGITQGGLDGNTVTGVDDVFVAKYNSSGVKQ